MISFQTPDEYRIEVFSGGDLMVQHLCDALNKSHFDGKLPSIMACAAQSIKHPEAKPIQAVTFRVSDVPELRGMQDEWLICIDQRFCEFPFLAQLLLHEMTHVLLPDEDPFHSRKFWQTLREKWLIDFGLVAGAGLNADEKQDEIVKKILAGQGVSEMLGL